MANKVTKAEYDEIKNKSFVVYSFTPKGKYNGHLTNVSIIKAVEFQQEQLLKGNNSIIISMAVWGGMPVIQSQKFDTSRMDYKVALYPLIAGNLANNEEITWKESVEYLKNKGYEFRGYDGEVIPYDQIS